MRADGIPAANAFTCWVVLSESAASSRAHDRAGISYAEAFRMET